MSSEDKNEPRLFWATADDRNPTGEFPPLTAADVEKLKPADVDRSAAEDRLEEDDWLKTALFKTSRVQSAPPQQDLATNISLSMQPTGQHASSPPTPPAVLRPAPSAPVSASLFDTARSLARPVAAVALGLVVAGAAIVFVASQNPDDAELASSDGTVVAERPPLAPALTEEQPSTGSLDPDETVEVEQTTTTVEATTSTKAKSELSEKTKAAQAAKQTTTTTQPPSTETSTTLPPTTEATTTQPPTTEATTTTETPTTQTSTTLEEESNSVD